MVDGLKKHKFGKETKPAVDPIPTLEDAFCDEISPHGDLEVSNQSLSHQPTAK